MPLNARKPRARHIHHPVIPCWTLIYSGRDPGKIWLGVCGGLANKWNVNAWLVRITFFLFVVPLGYVYYLGAQNMPDPSAR